MKVILVRHGEPRYDEVTARGFVGLGGGFGRLTAEGEAQALARASDPVFKGATIIVASPYTRALQTAAVISRITNIPLTVEHDLHEWSDDTLFKFDQPIQESYDAYIKNRGVMKENTKYRYETYENLRKRVLESIKKYKNHDKIIVVCHGVVISSLTHFEDLIGFCETREIDLNL
ncbi:MAG TPA: histidine phosphatase family protein [Bacilli bacterium]|nr:histidine phosphatase family protein [Bacilli bacterium]